MGLRILTTMKYCMTKSQVGALANDSMGVLVSLPCYHVCLVFFLHDAVLLFDNIKSLRGGGGNQNDVEEIYRAAA